MKKLFMLITLFAFTVALFAQDLGPEPKKITNIEDFHNAFNASKGGDVLHLEGAFPKIYITKKMFKDDKPLIIDGNNEAVVNVVSIMDCHNVTFQNMEIIGGVNLDDSYPEEYGLKNITLKNLYIHDCPSRGIFMGGHKISGIKIINCEIKRVIGNYNTHGIYLTGAHWENSIYGPVTDIVIRGCEIAYNPGGRNGIQLNGRFKGVKIENNKIYHFQQDGIELKGCQDVVIRGNIIYGGNRGPGVGLHDYIWQGWEPEAFKKCHHPCQNVLIEYNTIVVGPHGFSVDPWHGDHPDDGHPAIFATNLVHADPNFAPYPTKNIVIQHNIIHTPNKKIFDFAQPFVAAETSLIHNMVCCTSEKAGLPYIGGYDNLKLCQGNFLWDPDKAFIDGPPEYEGPIDLGIDPTYDWSKHNSHFNAFSWAGKKLSVGKKFPVVVMGDTATAVNE